MTPLPVHQHLDGIEQPGLFLNLVEDDQSASVIQTAHRVGRQSQPLVGVVEGQVYGWRRFVGGQEVTNQRGLPGLACTG